MSEQERMDHLLRETLAATPQPSLSSAFDQRLKKRLQPRRLRPGGRWIMIMYTAFTLIVSIGTMRSQSIGWGVIAIAILAPLVLAVAVQRRLA
jgi:hypothetical protein